MSYVEVVGQNAIYNLLIHMHDPMSTKLATPARAPPAPRTRGTSQSHPTHTRGSAPYARLWRATRDAHAHTSPNDTAGPSLAWEAGFRQIWCAVTTAGAAAPPARR